MWFRRNKSDDENRTANAAPKHPPLPQMRPSKKRRAKTSHAAARYYAAAKKDRLSAGWGSGVVSADSAIYGDLERLRARSRLLSVNDPYYRYWLRLMRRNVVGAQGIRLQMKVVKRYLPDGSEEKDDLANRVIEKGWSEWCKRQHCTVNRRMDFVAVQNMALESMLRDGEIFIRKIKGRKSDKFRFVLQLIEADHLDAGYNASLSGGRTIRMGVEFNDWGEAVAYHFHEKHPGDYMGTRTGGMQRIRVPASEIVHIYTPERADQTRGAPDGCASMTSVNMLNGYHEAELVAARVASSKMGFFTSPDGESYEGDDTETDENGDETGFITESDPGTFDQLPEGYSFTAYDPQHPTTAFPSFVKSMLRSVASGLGVNYNLMANDYEGVNFSSLRQANLNDRDCWKEMQRRLAEQLHEQIFSDWLLMALTADALPPLSAANFERLNAPSWRPRGWSWVDPLKEANANKINVEMGVDTLTSIASEQGRDIEEIFQEKKNDLTLAEKYGINISSGASDDLPSGASLLADDEQDDETDQQEEDDAGKN